MSWCSFDADAMRCFNGQDFSQSRLGINASEQDIEFY